MHIAITGGSGNFARVLIQHLHVCGHTVRTIDRPGSVQPESVADHRPIDLRDTDGTLVKNALCNCDAVVHLAAIPGPNNGFSDEALYANNTTISYNVLSAAGELGIGHVCLASSVNAIGGAFGRKTAYRAFPVDETQPCFAEDAYSLSKWTLEQQADATARRFDGMTLASMRFSALPERDPDPQDTIDEIGAPVAKGLWGYTRANEAARAVECAVRATFIGHEVFYIVAPRTFYRTPSVELARRHYPTVPFTRDLPGNSGFYDCAKAARLLGWQHE